MGASGYQGELPGKACFPPQLFPIPPLSSDALSYVHLHILSISFSPFRDLTVVSNLVSPTELSREL